MVARCYSVPCWEVYEYVAVSGKAVYLPAQGSEGSRVSHLEALGEVVSLMSFAKREMMKGAGIANLRAGKLTEEKIPAASNGTRIHCTALERKGRGKRDKNLRNLWEGVHLGSRQLPPTTQGMALLHETHATCQCVLCSLQRLHVCSLSTAEKLCGAGRQRSIAGD